MKENVNKRGRIPLIWEGVSDVSVNMEKKKIARNINNGFLDAKTIIYFLYTLTIICLFKGFLV